MIQSGKNVFIDNNTRLYVYSSTPPSGGAIRFFCADKEEFLKKCHSAIFIQNPGTMICFSKVFVLGLAHVADNQVVYKNYVAHNNKGGSKQWNDTDIKLHQNLGLDLNHIRPLRHDHSSV